MKKTMFFIICFIILISGCKASENEMQIVNYYKSYILYDNYFDMEISEQEYNDSSNEITNNNIETEYKKVSLSLSSDLAKLVVIWKKQPKVKSYDVITLSSDYNIFDLSTVGGKQIYNKGDTYKVIFYDNKSSNFKLSSNGIGFSMNLVDDANLYQLEIYARISKSKNNRIIYGNYRHAKKNISLTDSKKYTISSGNIVFNQSIDNYYDKIKSVTLNY